MILLSIVSLATSLILVLSLKKRNSLDSRLQQMIPGSGLSQENNLLLKRRLSRVSKSMRRQIDSQLADIVDLIASAVLTGQSLHSAIDRVVSRASGTVATELKSFLRNVELGQSLSSELDALCAKTPTASMKQFASKISIAITRGTPLAESLENLSVTLRERNSVDLLARAGANETKMLIPLVALVLPTTVIFALYPSVLVLNVGFN